MLALSEGRPISAEQLIDGLWGEAPPATAPKMVQGYVSHLRKAFAAAGNGAEIVTRGRSYELRLGDGGDLDVRRFERLVAAGTPRDALALWRGPPLDDVAAEPFAPLEIRRLEELRLAAVEQAIGQDSRLGATYASGRAYVWDIRSSSLVRQACRVAGRRLTRAEWAEFLPGRAYAPAC